MRRLLSIPLFVLLSCLVLPGFAAEVVPDAIKQPGTQPGEVSNFESPDKCDNCHGGYDSATYSNEPAFGWRGGAMGNAGRDPIFWATLAIAEQDFDGVGDLCIRCHSTGGWYAGRSAPTDGSGLQASDDDGVDWPPPPDGFPKGMHMVTWETSVENQGADIKSISCIAGPVEFKEEGVRIKITGQ